MLFWHIYEPAADIESAGVLILDFQPPGTGIQHWHLWDGRIGCCLSVPLALVPNWDYKPSLTPWIFGIVSTTSHLRCEEPRHWIWRWSRADPDIIAQKEQTLCFDEQDFLHRASCTKIPPSFLKNVSPFVDCSFGLNYFLSSVQWVSELLGAMGLALWRGGMMDWLHVFKS